MNGYEQLRESAAWLDMSGYGEIRATGEDRARLLNAMATNDVKNLDPGEGCYSFFSKRARADSWRRRHLQSG